jgi:hypothetical protein
MNEQYPDLNQLSDRATARGIDGLPDNVVVEGASSAILDMMLWRNKVQADDNDTERIINETLETLLDTSLISDKKHIERVPIDSDDIAFVEEFIRRIALQNSVAKVDRVDATHATDISGVRLAVSQTLPGKSLEVTRGYQHGE